MTERRDFTKEQRALIGATASLCISACPGAGKTHAIVQRFIERPVRHPRKGIALISFTNAAADEARRRIAAGSDLLCVPNFIGTIDAFINRYLVAPGMLERKGVSPTFRDKWSSLPNTTIDAGLAISPSLDAFVVDAQSAKLDIARLPYADRRTAHNLKPEQVSRLERLALGLWTKLVAGGTLTAAASRTALRVYLEDPNLKQQLAQLLTDRFSEVIVDEIQDCCEEDILVLELLREAGICLTVVGDLEQAIYGFRQQTATRLSAFLHGLPAGERLDGNFRSSPAICSIVDSLRSTDDSDKSVGRYQSDSTAVQLVSFARTNELPKKLMKISSDNHLGHKDMVVLAHAANTARSAAGAATEYQVGTSKLALLAAAMYIVSDESRSGAERSQALTSVGRYLRELGDDGDLQQQAYLAKFGITEREFREECLRLAGLVPDPYNAPPSALKTTLATATASQERLGWSSGSLRIPAGDDWPGVPKPSEAALSYSTVHGFKGLERTCVALVIPESTRSDLASGVDQWTAGTAGEARRVLYVGASRAERLLVIAAHRSIYGEVLSNLQRDGVPVEQV
ncbi:UvrD-helicase domain-containing protein [Kribbella kalugense]|uniref:UvrD-like helicase family protein n=1 Tax=Kribbella kalugense TaxID=2512221 RepID=A0A4R8A1U6_9ACTN|nr:UvrD-helicase domain-containing protein [Kribbella kalugense]TDW22120.1 UvrD-like helicase family protein [Kribbella kalugense]